MPDAIQLYRDFLAGNPGTCIFTGKENCHAFVTEDEIDATFGSRYDTNHFVWLDKKPGDVALEGTGFISDDYIDKLLAANRIALCGSDRDGPLGENHEGIKAAFLLGANRMSRIMALPVDAQKCVPSEASRSLPLGLRVHIDGLGLPEPIALAQLVEKMIPQKMTIKDSEARGRLFVLSRIAVGADLSDIEDEAERFADLIIDHARREKVTNEITRQMLEQLSSETIQD